MMEAKVIELDKYGEKGTFIYDLVLKYEQYQFKSGEEENMLLNDLLNIIQDSEINFDDKIHIISFIVNELHQDDFIFPPTRTKQ